MFSIFSVTLQCMFYFPCNDKNPGSGVGVAPCVFLCGCFHCWLMHKDSTKANVSVTTDISFTTREAKVAINQLCVNTFSYNVTNIHLHYSSVLHLVIFPAVSSKSSVFHVFGSSWFYILQTQLYQVLRGHYWPQIISGFLAVAEDKSQHIGLNKGNSGSNIYKMHCRFD